MTEVLLPMLPQCTRGVAGNRCPMIFDEPGDPSAHGWSLKVEQQEDGAVFAADMRCPAHPF